MLPLAIRNNSAASIITEEGCTDMSKMPHRRAASASAARPRPLRPTQPDDWWRQDGRALRGDWVVVGQDIRKSLKRFAEEKDAQEEAGIATEAAPSA